MLNKFFDCEQKSLPGYQEIQGTSESILLHKMEAAYEAFKTPVLVDDTSVHFESLNGFPGPYIKDFISHIPVYEMGVKFAGSRIRISCWLGFHDGVQESIIAEGSISGDIVKPKDIDPGVREFDLFVQVDGTDRPMIEFTPEEKNKFSHRGKAMKNLIEKLQLKNPA